MLAFLDLDGVIVDSMGEMARIHGHDPSILTSWTIHECLGLTEEDCWAKCHGYDYWFNCKPMPEAYDVVATVDYFTVGSWRFLTSPKKGDNECFTAKADWILKYFPQFLRKLTIGDDKHHFAHPDTVLIDDSDENVRRFREAGGRGILYPATWNANRDITDKVDYLERELFKVTE